MTIPDLTLKDLTYIAAVAEHLSFSRAAEACSVSQPALSKQIKSVEKTLGTPLFERSKRHVLLTEAGNKLIPQIRKILSEAEILSQLTLTDQKPLSGLFRLGAIASSCPYLLPYFVGALSESYPDLKLIIKEGLTDPLIEDLKQGNLDAVIAATTFEADGLHAIPLFFEPFVLAFNPHHARYSAKVSVSNIDTTQLLLLEDGHCLKDQTLDICAIQESNSLMSFKATSLETLLQMTAGGLGISVIPKLAVPHSGLSETLTFSEFKNKKNGRTMALFYRQGYPLFKNMVLLAQFIQSSLSKSLLENQSG